MLMNEMKDLIRSIISNFTHDTPELEMLIMLEPWLKQCEANYA